MTSSKQIGKVNLKIFFTSFCQDLNGITRRKGEENELLLMHSDSWHFWTDQLRTLSNPEKYFKSSI